MLRWSSMTNWMVWCQVCLDDLCQPKTSHRKHTYHNQNVHHKPGKRYTITSKHAWTSFWASNQIVYGVYYLFSGLSRQNELITVGVVSPVFPFTLFAVLLDAHSAYGEVVCVLFFIKTPKQLSSDVLSPRHPFSYIRDGCVSSMICEDLD